jgi:hypothetical protein
VTVRSQRKGECADHAYGLSVALSYRSHLCREQVKTSAKRRRRKQVPTQKGLDREVEGLIALALVNRGVYFLYISMDGTY